jgi:hypothetical protein
MTKNNAAVPPQPNNRNETGTRQRNEKGQFVRGNKNGGRPKLREEFKKFAQEKSIEALKMVYNVMTAADTNQRDRTAAARLLMEYGYGRPAAEFDRERVQMDRERLEMDKKRADLESGEKSIKIVLSDDLRELAK